MTTRTERIRSTLDKIFSPEVLELKDDSAKHAKHATRMNRVARSRAVHEALDAEFKSGLHALALDLKTPGE
jgi:BolA protein